MVFDLVANHRRCHHLRRPDGMGNVEDRMTIFLRDDEVLALMQSNAPMEKARTVLSQEMGRIKQADQLRRLSVFELRRMEFEAVAKIAVALGVPMPNSIMPVWLHNKVVP